MTFMCAHCALLPRPSVAQGLTLSALLRKGTSIQLPEGVLPMTTSVGMSASPFVSRFSGPHRIPKNSALTATATAVGTPHHTGSLTTASASSSTNDRSEREWFAAAAAAAAAATPSARLSTHSPTKKTASAARDDAVSPVELAKQCLNRASDPTELVCRDDERSRITKFITEHMHSETPGSLYDLPKCFLTTDCCFLCWWLIRDSTNR